MRLDSPLESKAFLCIFHPLPLPQFNQPVLARPFHDVRVSLDKLALFKMDRSSFFRLVVSFCLFLPFLPGLCKRRCDYEREHDRRLRVHLHAVPAHLDLAPADRLVRAGPGIAPVKLLCRVDVDGALGAVAHQARVGDVVFDQPAAEDDHVGALGVDGEVVESADVAGDGDVEDGGGGAEGVEVEHVAQGAVGEGGAEDGDGVSVGPVEDGGLVGDFGAEAGDDGARGPDEAVRVRGGGFARAFLFGEHCVEDGHEPVFEGAVVAVGHDEVADSVHALFP